MENALIILTPHWLVYWNEASDEGGKRKGLESASSAPFSRKMYGLMYLSTAEAQSKKTNKGFLSSLFVT